MILNATFVFYLIFIFIISSMATWRISHMINLEDGPMDIFIRIRTWVGLTPYAELDDDEQLDALQKLNLNPMDPIPTYIHNGSSLAKWFECHACISVLVGLGVTLYLAINSLVAWPLIPIYALALSFISIKYEISL